MQEPHRSDGFVPGAGPTGSGGSSPSAAGSGATTSGVAVTDSTEALVVHVAGAVRRPGVYDLPAGARIRDAVAKAGGGKPRADLDSLNLAAKVTDGQQVLVVRRGRAPGGGAASAPAAGGKVAGGAASQPGGGAAAAGGAGATVNVNQATAAELEQLDGVGPAIAAKIVDWRTQNGPFRSVDDLAQVAGIGPKKLEAMRAQVVT